MKYKVKLVNRNGHEQAYECNSIEEANRIAEDLKSAFPKQIRTGELSIVISNE